MNKFGHRVLFAEDMVMYFIKRFRGKWSSGFYGNAYDEYSRYFTEEMGSVAWYLAHSNKEARLNNECGFYIKTDCAPEFSRGYNPEHFLHYCGVLAYASACRSRYGNVELADETVFAIISYLSEINRDGSFSARSGWGGLQTYALESLEKMEIASFAERILFAEDLMRFFMIRTRVRWTPGTDGNNWPGHRRRFTEAIASATWFYATTLPDSYRLLLREYRYKDSERYHPLYFLQYCGMMAWSSIQKFVNGYATFPDWAVLDIVAYLGEHDRDDSFPEGEGWYGLQKFARLVEMYQEDYGDVELMEQQCIGSLLQDS